MRTLLLIDANSLIHRFFHAMPPLTTPRGEPIGAIYGLSQVLLKIIREMKPDYIAGCFDRPEPTFRDEIYKEYKIHRPAAPGELISQIIKSRELFGKFGVKVVELAGYEADDLIGTLAEKFKNEPDLRIEIFSGDLDNLQLVDGNKVIVRFLIKGVTETTEYNEEAVIKKYELKPEQLPDLKGFLGDASDNIPGVKGVGPKTATPLVKEFGSIEKIYEDIVLVEEKTAKKIRDHKEEALFSKKLATIKRDVPVDLNMDDVKLKSLDIAALKAYFSEMGFQSLVNRLQ